MQNRLLEKALSASSIVQRDISEEGGSIVGDKDVTLTRNKSLYFLGKGNGIVDSIAVD